MINFTTRMDISNKARHLVDNLMAETDYLKQAEIIRKETNIAVLKEAVLIFRRTRDRKSVV